MDRRATRDQSEALGSPTPILEQKAALAAYGTEAGPTNLKLGGRCEALEHRKGRVQGLLRWIDRVVENRPMAQIIFWVVLACAAEAEVWQRAMDLQGSSTHEGDFPHPLLLVPRLSLKGFQSLASEVWLSETCVLSVFQACFSCFVASGFLQLLLLALRIFRRRFGEQLGVRREPFRRRSKASAGSGPAAGVVARHPVRAGAARRRERGT